MSIQCIQFERDKDHMGLVRAINPSSERDNKSVASVPLSFDEYFTFERIVKMLAKWRVRVIPRRHDAEFYASHFKGEKQPAEIIKCVVSKYLPSRNKWTRPRYKQRKRLRSSAAVFTAMIERTVFGYRDRGTLCETDWGKALLALVEAVQTRVRNGKFEFVPPRLKFIEKGENQFRMLASYENVEDRIIIRGASEYLKDVFDPLLDARCYSFRLSPEKNNQKAIEELVQYRQTHKGEVYVAECDIQKFFDVLNHQEVLRVYDAFATRCTMPVDLRGRKVLEAYLNSYNANEYPQRVATNDSDVAAKLSRVASISKEVLQELYDGMLATDLRLGIPQGGALSPLIANMFLTDVDQAVQDGADEHLFYVRFCDDMIIAHTEKSKCAAVMAHYLQLAQQKLLPVHKTPRDGFVYGSKYYGLKTKGPFAWKSAAVGEKDVAPWVSFLGNQISFEGKVRIRRETIERHINKLRQERDNFVRRMKRGSSVFKKECSDSVYNLVCNRFVLRMVSKGVGFMCAGIIPKDGMCWVNAFPAVLENPSIDCERQMRKLDSARDHLMRPIGNAYQKDGHKYFFGRPYSYFGFLKMLPRPVSPTSNVSNQGNPIKVRLGLAGLMDMPFYSEC
jgi:hypothetical protein